MGKYECRVCGADCIQCKERETWLVEGMNQMMDLCNKHCHCVERLAVRVRELEVRCQEQSREIQRLTTENNQMAMKEETPTAGSHQDEVYKKGLRWGR